MNLHSKKRLREVEFDDSMSIGNLRKGQQSKQEAIRKLQNLNQVFQEGIIDFVLYESIIHQYLPSLPKELTKNVFDPDLAESQTVNPPPKRALDSFVLKIKKLIGTFATAGSENGMIINEILNNGITEEQKNDMSLLNNQANGYWEIMLAEDKRYGDNINSINTEYYQKQIDKDLKRAKGNQKVGNYYGAYTQEIAKPKLLKQNVKNLTYEDYLPILSKLGLSESKKVTLKSYLEKKLTVSSKEAELIESVIKEYIRKKNIKRA